MSHEATKALEKIVRLCERSDNLTYRQICIFEIALEGLGYVAKQRAEMLAKWKAPMYERLQAKRDRQMAKFAEAAQFDQQTKEDSERIVATLSSEPGAEAKEFYAIACGTPP